jgi:hypothetical protein
MARRGGDGADATGGGLGGRRGEQRRADLLPVVAPVAAAVEAVGAEPQLAVGGRRRRRKKDEGGVEQRVVARVDGVGGPRAGSCGPGHDLE